MYAYTLIRQHHYICNILYMYNYMFIYSNFQIKIMMHENPEGTWKSKKKKKKKKEAKTAVHRYNECPTLPLDKYLQNSRICNSFPRFIQCSLHTQIKSCAYINFRSKMKK